MIDEDAALLLIHCRFCEHELIPQPLYSKSGAMYCPEHGDFFIQRLRGEKPVVVFRSFEGGLKAISGALSKPRPRNRNGGNPGQLLHCNQTGAIFSSIKEASNAMNIDPSTIHKHLNGRRKSIGGYTFSRVDRLSPGDEIQPPVLRAGSTSRAFPIVCNENGKTYASIRQAAKDLRLAHEGVRRQLIGMKDTVAGYTFRKADIYA